ncbi:MAG: RNA polymerase sigma factor RpoD/SigA [Verrucomicrobiae bacterium]|nr:RNA polymerase sigma factor RpoD/SigA [Verrucomicrobiae bacterium]
MQSIREPGSCNPPSGDSPMPRESAKSPPRHDSDEGSLKIYLREIAQTALLTRQEEISLAKRIRRGDAAARAHMIQANLRLVVKIAHDYANLGLPIEDLISEGNIGLMKAVERFDPHRGVKLSTYAAWWIKQSIKRALANQSKTIRLPVHVVDKLSRIRKVSAKMADVLGREPNDEEISEEMGIPQHKISQLKTVSLRPSSLDAPVGDDDRAAFGEIVADESALDPFEMLRDKALRKDVLEIVEELDERERAILVARFGLDGAKPLTLEIIGRKFKVTRERIRQIQNLALRKIRALLQQQDIPSRDLDGEDVFVGGDAAEAPPPRRPRIS